MSSHAVERFVVRYFTTTNELKQLAREGHDSSTYLELQHDSYYSADIPGLSQDVSKATLFTEKLLREYLRGRFHQRMIESPMSHEVISVSCSFSTDPRKIRHEELC